MNLRELMLLALLGFALNLLGCQKWPKIVALTSPAVHDTTVVHDTLYIRHKPRR